MGLDRGHVHKTCTFSASEVKQNTATNVAKVKLLEKIIYFYEFRGNLITESDLMSARRPL